MLTNLLVNAAQYGETQRPVILAASGEAERIILQVTNYGVAIPPDALQLIFKPLVQLTPTDVDDVRPRTSLGLGLFVAREIALAHGGTIDASSDATAGTVLTVYLPRRTTPVQVSTA